jgi:hypothetical protein
VEIFSKNYARFADKTHKQSAMAKINAAKSFILATMNYSIKIL